MWAAHSSVSYTVYLIMSLYENFICISYTQLKYYWDLKILTEPWISNHIHRFRQQVNTHSCHPNGCLTKPPFMLGNELVVTSHSLYATIMHPYLDLSAHGFKHGNIVSIEYIFYILSMFTHSNIPEALCSSFNTHRSWSQIYLCTAKPCFTFLFV